MAILAARLMPPSVCGCETLRPLTIIAPSANVTGALAMTSSPLSTSTR